MQLRQGDVFLEKIDDPVDFQNMKKIERDKNRVILAYGEMTGHAHVVLSPATSLFEDPEGERYLQVEEDTSLDHEEHSTLPLYSGIYKVSIQREYSPKEIKRVVD